MEKIERCPTCHRRYRRSNEANGRYWLLLHKVSEKLQPQGIVYSAETWHTFFKSRYLGCDEVTLPNKKTLQLPRSSADLDVSEFSDYMTKIEVWAGEYDVWLDELPA